MNWLNRPVKTSLSCNKELLLSLRRERGWTQSELANLAGFTERLISKAESGAAISVETIEILAEAFSRPERRIYPDDLVSDPVQLSKDFLTAIYVHQANFVDAVLGIVDEEIEVQMAGERPAIPFAGIYRGIPGLRELARLFFQYLEMPPGRSPLEDFQYIGRGTEVVVWGDSWMHPIGGPPLEEPMPASHLFRFRAGKLVWMEDRFDTLRGAQLLEGGVRLHEHSQTPKPDTIPNKKI